MARKILSVKFETDKDRGCVRILCNQCNCPVQVRPSKAGQVILACLNCTYSEVWPKRRYQKYVAKFMPPPKQAEIEKPKAPEPPPEQEHTGNIVCERGFAVPASANPTFGEFSPAGNANKSHDDSEPSESKTGQGCLTDKKSKRIIEGKY